MIVCGWCEQSKRNGRVNSWIVVEDAATWCDWTPGGSGHPRLVEGHERRGHPAVRSLFQLGEGDASAIPELSLKLSDALALPPDAQMSALVGAEPGQADARSIRQQQDVVGACRQAVQCP